MSEILIGGISIIQNPEIVLFDKDGTLIDIHHYWSSMIKLRSSHITNQYFSDHHERKNIEHRLIEAMGVDLKIGKMKPEGPVGIQPRPYIVDIASNVVRSNGVDIQNSEMETIFFEVDKETTRNILPLLKLLPGVVNLLENLTRCGIVCAVVSTDITDRARLAMEALGLNHYFDEIIGADLVKNTKPAPDLALTAITKCNCNSSKTVVVGDHPVDIEMGKSAGTGLNIGVLTGLSNNNMFEGLECAVVQDLNSIEVRC